ncbi:hypothetical protein PsorP6_009338 [Peronosclerospora sorghi]|uniref:Uncharacterized protein n=1 Tax=Peronosclerospora sorghi TaxID=230839 RepID=A0ACC0W0I9_9STRA|nr:hypothetical protein PsorP6_009338 [Peronosclerospora sorghi]
MFKFFFVILHCQCPTLRFMINTYILEECARMLNELKDHEEWRGQNISKESKEKEATADRANRQHEQNSKKKIISGNI